METVEFCQLLPWDSDFFGKRIGRAIVHRLSPETVEAIVKWCETHAIECLYFLADSDHMETVRLAEDNGFRFVDIRVSLQCNVIDRQARYSDDPSQTVRVRHSRQSDIATLQTIARTSHSDSRFYFDPCFPADSCEALYETWIKRSCEGYADVVLVAELNDQPVGYVSCHLMGNEPRGQIGLVGVGSQARGRGLGRILIDHSLHWFSDQTVERVRVVTQGRNISAQRLYQSCGFTTKSVQLWYHRWLFDCTSPTDS
jgi:dTDP-4-amino-4,6-dideoxy-D-galactose acyltransferase